MITLVKGVELPYLPAVDTNLQVRGTSDVYFTDNNTFDKSAWFVARANDTIKLPSGKQFYLFSNSSNVLAEMAV